MKNELLTSYQNISKLLELVPNTNEYIAHRKLMSHNEIEVVKYLKKKHADQKHRTLKKQCKLDGKINIDDGNESTSTSDSIASFSKYNETYFYKIVCKDASIKDVYVGYTTDFIRRKAKHKNNCINVASSCHNYYVYKFIRENRGWDNWEVLLIEKAKCYDKLDALSKERKYIQELGATLNTQHSSITSISLDGKARNNNTKLKLHDEVKLETHETRADDAIEGTINSIIELELHSEVKRNSRENGTVANSLDGKVISPQVLINKRSENQTENVMKSITHELQNAAASTDKCENEIIDRQLTANSDIEVTSDNEAGSNRVSNSSVFTLKVQDQREPQEFQIYDEEDEFTNEIDDVIDELASSAAEKYHGVMDKTTFQQFLELQHKQIQLAKSGNDNDEFEMVQSQLTNMMDEADEKEMMNKPIDKVMKIAIQGILENIDAYLHKDKILQHISELQKFTITSENTDEWMPTYLKILRLKAIPKQSRNRKNNRKKTRR
jgi:hypothetical protein